MQSAAQGAVEHAIRCTGIRLTFYQLHVARPTLHAYAHAPDPLPNRLTCPPPHRTPAP